MSGFDFMRFTDAYGGAAKFNQTTFNVDLPFDQSMSL